MRAVARVCAAAAHLRDGQNASARRLSRRPPVCIGSAGSACQAHLVHAGRRCSRRRANPSAARGPGPPARRCCAVAGGELQPPPAARAGLRREAAAWSCHNRAEMPPSSWERQLCDCVRGLLFADLRIRLEHWPGALLVATHDRRLEDGMRHQRGISTLTQWRETRSHSRADTSPQSRRPLGGRREPVGEPA